VLFLEYNHIRYRCEENYHFSTHKKKMRMMRMKNLRHLSKKNLRIQFLENSKSLFLSISTFIHLSSLKHHSVLNFSQLLFVKITLNLKMCKNYNFNKIFVSGTKISTERIKCKKISVSRDQRRFEFARCRMKIIWHTFSYMRKKKLFLCCFLLLYFRRKFPPYDVKKRDL